MTQLQQAHQQPSAGYQIGPGKFLETGLTWMFGLFLVSSAFSIAIAQIALGGALTLFVLLVLLGRNCNELRSPGRLYLIMGLYVGWLVISSLSGDTPIDSLVSLREEWLFLILPIGLFVLRDPITRRRMLLALAAGVGLAAIYGIIQHFTGEHWFKDQTLHTAGDNFRLSGNFSHPLTYGYYIVVATIFLLGYLTTSFKSLPRWQQIVLSIVAAAGLTAAILCNSRGPLLALGAGLLAIGLLHRNIYHCLAALLVILILGTVLSFGTISKLAERMETDLDPQNYFGRLYIWNNSLKILDDNPLLGTGPGNFHPAYTALLPPNSPPAARQAHAHNDFLNTAAIGGLPALALYLGIWAIILGRLWPMARARSGNQDFAVAALAATVTFLAASMTVASFADEELRQLLTALWAFGLAGYEQVSTTNVRGLS